MKGKGNRMEADVRLGGFYEPGVNSASGGREVHAYFEKRSVVTFKWKGIILLIYLVDSRPCGAVKFDLNHVDKIFCMDKQVNTPP